MALFQYKDLILDGVNNAYQGSKNATAERNRAFDTALQGAGKTIANLKQWNKEQDELNKQNELEEYRQRLIASINNKRANMNLQDRINNQEAYDNALEEYNNALEEYNKQLEEYNQAQSDYENYEALDFDEDMTDEQIRELQEKVGTNVDGKWGKKSKAALKAYQDRHTELGNRFESMKKPEMPEFNLENPNENIADLQDKINLNSSGILGDEDYKNLSMYLASKFGDNTYLTQYNADKQLEAMNAEKEATKLHEAEEAIKNGVKEAELIIAKYKDEKSNNLATNETQLSFNHIIADLQKQGYDTSELEASMENAIGEKVEAAKQEKDAKDKKAAEKKAAAAQKEAERKKQEKELNDTVNGLK